ncbi:hypothetical protein BHF71_01595 [Vulcanibacillus modesticaldus]|uniref:Uncharacterized protein n=1 Tax=Vulcanibacillus modesticaldus TaxID=337097 RepID=A0A1D2YUH3_9BACI|nr:hypothetical protein [Vulcanibacillus modesticaldus]OEF99311.1 hypothetical protein BHF71_01595 [Vulcanibacillus modesticaldus]
MRLKKVVSILLLFSLIFTLSNNVLAKNPHLIIKKNNAKVFFIDKDGNFIRSSKSIDFFLNLSKEGVADANDVENEFSINAVVIDGSAIRITDSVFREITNEDLNVVVSVIAGTVFNMSWAKLGGYLKKAQTLEYIAEATWKGSFAAASAAVIYDLLLDAGIDPTYIEYYQYKQWSDYWGAYIVYDVMIRYEDSNFNNPIEVQYWESGMETTLSD